VLRLAAQHCLQTELNLITLIYQESNESLFIHSRFPGCCFIPLFAGKTPLDSLAKNRPFFTRLRQRMGCCTKASINSGIEKNYHFK
jgi:hypothetical protein